MNAGLYLAFARIAFLSQLEYRGQYAVRMVAKVLGWSSGFIMVLVLLNRFHTIAGWDRYEVLMLYGLDLLSYSAAATWFMGSFGKLPLMIRKGELDGILTKPVNPMVYLICTRTSAGYTSNYVIAVAILAVCMRKLDISWSPGMAVWLALDIVGASLIQAAGFVFTSVPAFWIGKSEGLYRLFFKDLTEFLRYPLSVYHRGIQVLLTFVVPYAFINYYPVQLFLDGKKGGFHPVFCYLTPAVGAGMFAAAYGFWLLGLRAYQGAGT